MKKNDFQQTFFQQTGACALVIGSLALAGNSDAATAVGTASATVVESASVSIIEPPTPVTIPVLSGTIFNLESFTESLSTSGPLLRIGSPPPSGAPVTGGEGGTGAQGGSRAGAAPSAANSATVSVTRKADGSLSVSGGTGLTFAVSQSTVGAVNIEYN